MDTGKEVTDSTHSELDEALRTNGGRWKVMLIEPCGFYEKQRLRSTEEQ